MKLKQITHKDGSVSLATKGITIRKNKERLEEQSIVILHDEHNFFEAAKKFVQDKPKKAIKDEEVALPETQEKLES